MLRNLIVMTVCCLLFVAARSGSADMISYSNGFGSNESTSGFVSLPTFELEMGDLQFLEIEISADMQMFVGVENPDNQPGTASGSSAGGLSFASFSIAANLSDMASYNTAGVQLFLEGKGGDGFVDNEAIDYWTS